METLQSLRSLGSSTLDSIPLIGTYKLGIEGIIGKKFDGRDLSSSLRIISIVTMFLATAGKVFVVYGFIKHNSGYEILGGILYLTSYIPWFINLGDSWWHTVTRIREDKKIFGTHLVLEWWKSLQIKLKI